MEIDRVRSCLCVNDRFRNVNVTAYFDVEVEWCIYDLDRYHFTYALLLHLVVFYFRLRHKVI